MIFQPGAYYHVFNRTIHKEFLFRSDENYRFFIKTYKEYLGKPVQTLAYCLMPTHFHFFVRINDVQNEVIEKAFKNFFISYAKAFNKMYERHGSIFQAKYKKKEVDDEFYFTRIIAYIHLNPVEAQILKSGNSVLTRLF